MFREAQGEPRGHVLPSRRYLRSGCADLAASVEALVDELDWEELKRQEERYEAFADESADGFRARGRRAWG